MGGHAHLAAYDKGRHRGQEGLAARPPVMAASTYTFYPPGPASGPASLPSQMALCCLDREMALVLVSAVERHGPGAASPSANAANPSSGVAPEGQSITATVEHMEKISKDEKNALERAMTLEWKSVLTTISEGPALPKLVSSSELEYWTQSPSKLRRLESEPASPKR